jgi:hypothetical protein
MRGERSSVRRPVPRALVNTIGGGGAIVALIAGVLVGGVRAGSPATQVSRTVDTQLCPFPLAITVARRDRSDQLPATALRFTFRGPSTITLRNGATGRAAVLRSTGSYTVDTRTGAIAFRGHHIWLWSTGKRVPFLSTDGEGSFGSDFVLSGDRLRARVIDPCALVAAPPTSTTATPAPWELPANPLSHIGRAGLTPLLGRVIRHDHVHLDVLVDGLKVPVPGGVGLVEPKDRGPCPPDPTPVGDCTTGESFFAEVANSPLHTHSSSGIVHIESDRHRTYTLGEFFDEWGVRFESSCIGSYCAGDGKELRVYVNGRRVPGDARRLALTNRQEIAVVFGGPNDFRSVPSTYKGGWPGPGCGGAGERSCLP